MLLTGLIGASPFLSLTGFHADLPVSSALGIFPSCISASGEDCPFQQVAAEVTWIGGLGGLTQLQKTHSGWPGLLGLAGDAVSHSSCLWILPCPPGIEFTATGKQVACLQVVSLRSGLLNLAAPWRKTARGCDSWQMTSCPFCLRGSLEDR